MRTLRLIILVLPWILVVGLLIGLYFTISNDRDEPGEIVNSTVILKEVEALGKLELVKYNFKEITEVQELSKKYLNIFQLGPDAKIALISEGHAVGCIDLTKLSEDDIEVGADTVYVKLPRPELCYYKLDLDNTRIYSLRTNPLKDEKAFIERAYGKAEKNIKETALNSGILKQAEQNGELMLKPLIENLTKKKVVFVNRPEEVSIPTLD